MTTSRLLAACLCGAAAISLAGCGGGTENVQPAANTANSAAANRAGAAATPAAATGVEKVKPAPGTGNVQGKVLYNGKPVENIEVKLCETFNQYFGGCGGKTYEAKTDAGGEYVITNVEPKVYEGLMARVFDTDSYVFATTGIAGLSSAKYEVTADKTLFVQPTSLFKGDLKLVNPKAGSKVSAQNLELKWEPYPDAAYYKFSIYPEEATVTSPYVNERVEATTFAVDKPLQKGTYRWQVTAYNGSDQKLSESSRDIKFTITDGAQ
ncbi:MAG TPA: hypothetical protein VG148_11525 [Pyrinomonadaceae bacterium]|nr:hypothetical protein [Pyrinomonadaceae bacterium]